MILGIATVVVLVLVAIALLPAKTRGRDGSSGGGASNLLQSPAKQSNLRQQQMQEEAEAIADEYQRRADEAWRDELGQKATALLQTKRTTASRTTMS